MKMKMRINSLLLGTLLLCAAAHAQDHTTEGFADYLFQKGEYYRAITEYYRLSHDAGDTMKKAELLRNIGRCYYRGGDYEGFIRFNEENSQFFRAQPSALSEMYLLLGKSYYQLDKYSDAINVLEWSGIKTGNAFFGEMLVLSGIAYSRTHDWEAAGNTWDMVEQDSDWKMAADNLRANLGNVSDLPERKPFLAGMFSAIIPGTGYLYCGRPGTGIASLLINGLLLWAFSDAIKHEQYGIAAMTGFLGIGWYIGNIVGSVGAAHTYNDNTRREYLNHMLESENLHEYVKNK